MTYATVTEAARAGGVHEDTIRRWFDEGLIEGIRTVKGHRRISLESLDAALRGHTVERTVAPEPTVAQFCSDSVGWFGWAPVPTMTDPQAEAMIGQIRDAQRALAGLESALIAHLDR